MSEAAGVSFLAVAPEIALGLGAVIILLVDVARHPGPRVHAGLVTLSLAAAAGLTVWQGAVVRADGASTWFAGMVRLDDFGVVGRGVVVLATALGMLAAWTLVSRLGTRGAEALALALVSATGFMLMAASAHFFVLFLGLEVGSISLYILAGYVRESPRSDEAAVKYFLLGSFASALFIYGVALAYAGTGALAFDEVAAALGEQTVPAIAYVALALLVGGLAFKVTAAPFHSWAPDVYQGAPAEFVGFMAAVAKVGGFAGLMLVLLDAFEPVEEVWQGAIAGVAGVSVLVGTIFAIVQDDARRMLAYSGVAHAGFLLTGLVAGAAAVPNLWFYLVAYTMVLVTAFAVVAVVAATSGGDTSMRSLSGLSTRSPFLAAVLAILLIALAGIPITSGFVAKFGIFAAAWGAGFEWLVILGLVASVAAFFFYLRVIVVMYFTAPVQAEAPGTATARPEVPATIRWLAVVVVTVTLVLGVIPGPLLELLADSAP
ncbi:MAG TPA: NADH-quinone oxidoreductase subunit N [Acidimicrobiia bacterium]|nr:NADH-quinone oxidoreductase subunit N [Acidimicrobiia bacterium]